MPVRATVRDRSLNANFGNWIEKGEYGYDEDYGGQQRFDPGGRRF